MSLRVGAFSPSISGAGAGAAAGEAVARLAFWTYWIKYVDSTSFLYSGARWIYVPPGVQSGSGDFNYLAYDYAKGIYPYHETPQQEFYTLPYGPIPDSSVFADWEQAYYRIETDGDPEWASYDDDWGLHQTGYIQQDWLVPTSLIPTTEVVPAPDDSEQGFVGRCIPPRIALAPRQRTWQSRHRR